MPMLSLEKRERILAMFREGHGRNEIARKLKVGHSTVTAIVKADRKTPAYLMTQRDKGRIVRLAAEAAIGRTLMLVQAGMVAVDDDWAEEDYRSEPKE